MTNSNNRIPPRVLNYKNNIITSIKKIAEIANNHYINKITSIRNNFVKSSVSPIVVLSNLIKKQTLPSNYL